MQINKIMRIPDHPARADKSAPTDSRIILLKAICMLKAALCIVNYILS